MDIHSKYMHRCLQLARLGKGFVAPNPMVGAVLVHNDRIIGEGYHQQYRQAHAEVNCINSVAKEDIDLIRQSVLYVNLEPCAHYGKTPPCADFVISKSIPKVVIGCTDPFGEVNGKGIETLIKAGTAVITNILEKESMYLNRRFFTFHMQRRPYIILKWAQTADGFIADNYNTSEKLKTGNTVDSIQKPRLLISNEYSNRMVHKWRSQEAAIMVGTNTALWDNPSLTVRLWEGIQPVRIILDMHLRLPSDLKIFDQAVKTIVLNDLKDEGTQENLLFFKLNRNQYLGKSICDALYQLNIQSVLIEGGSRLLQTFIDEGIYDEVRIIKNDYMYLGDGIKAPIISDILLKEKISCGNDKISYFTRKDN